jgi:hypothetical protein
VLQVTKININAMLSCVEKARALLTNFLLIVNCELVCVPKAIAVRYHLDHINPASFRIPNQ